MLNVLSCEDALNLLCVNFGALRVGVETACLSEARGRVLACAVEAEEDVPSFNRSMVDGYALRADDSFGCSETLPSILTLAGDVAMGTAPSGYCDAGQCYYVPTGGALPQGSDAMAMIEHAEVFCDGTVGIMKPVAKGQHVIFCGDDVHRGQVVLSEGTLLGAHHIGALAALGVESVPVYRRPVVGVLSTGDELLPAGGKPEAGQIRDVNSPMLCAEAEEVGCEGRSYGICGDDLDLLTERVRRMAQECDVVVLSGGSSVGLKDHGPEIAEKLGRLLFHGVAVKPGKPTVAGEIAGKPFFGLPGHPVAAYFVFRIFVVSLLESMQGRQAPQLTSVPARLSSAIPSNHGREEYVAVRLEQAEPCPVACPVMGKSGLITQLSSSDGWLKIPRDCEGLPAHAPVDVFPFINRRS